MLWISSTEYRFLHVGCKWRSAKEKRKGGAQDAGDVLVRARRDDDLLGPGEVPLERGVRRTVGDDRLEQRGVLDVEVPVEDVLAGGRGSARERARELCGAGVHTPQVAEGDGLGRRRGVVAIHDHGEGRRGRGCGGYRRREGGENDSVRWCGGRVGEQIRPLIKGAAYVGALNHSQARRRSKSHVRTRVHRCIRVVVVIARLIHRRSYITIHSYIGSAPGYSETKPTAASASSIEITVSAALRIRPTRAVVRGDRSRTNFRQTRPDTARRSACRI
jgi:hypothetical protein